MAIVAAMSSLFFIGSREEQQYLFTDLETQDISAIAKYLDGIQYDHYTIDSKGVKVPIADVPRLRLELSQEGLPNQGTVGWETFDQESFSRTEFEQEVLRIRAIQGELARTISSIQGVKSARVHIVMPKKSLFVREEKKPTAAIYINTKRGFQIEQKQIRGIQFLVSKSVEGLDTNQVTIVDSEGKMLTEPEPTDQASKQSTTLMAYKKSLEKSLESRILSLVGRVVGQDRIEAKVDAEVDFTLEKQTISDIDPEDVVVISKNTTGFSMEGQGLNPTGIPGSKSNVPGEQESVAGATSKAGSKRDSEIVNYEFSKTVSEKTLSVGKIDRLTVSAIVDGKQIYPLDGSVPDFSPRTEEEMAKISELIKNAVGFKEGRDSLTVHNMMFQLDQTQIMGLETKKSEDRAYFMTLATSAAVALALIFFFVFIVRPYFRWLSYDPERKEDQQIVEEYRPEIETSKLQRVKILEDVPFEKMSPKEKVTYLAKHEPKRTTEAIKMLLNAPGG